MMLCKLLKHNIKKEGFGKMRGILIIIMLFFISIPSFALDVESIECGLNIKNRTIVNKSEEFKVGDRVYCLSTVKNIDKTTTIINRWIIDNMKYDIKLKVKPYKRFRTWSYKTVYRKGVWKMEVLDEHGKLIKEKIFVVK